MESLPVSIYLIAAIFFVIAFVYTSVGLGGGSSYTALMAILGFNTLVIPGGKMPYAMELILTKCILDLMRQRGHLDEGPHL